MKILGIDYGTKRVGLALSFESLAEPLGIIENTPSLIDELRRTCLEQNVEKIVVGISDREMAKRTKGFVEQLQLAIQLPVDYIDESYSSVKVQALLHEAKTTQKKRREPIDHFAATYILQEYLDTRSD